MRSIMTGIHMRSPMDWPTTQMRSSQVQSAFVITSRTRSAVEPPGSEDPKVQHQSRSEAPQHDYSSDHYK